MEQNESREQQTGSVATLTRFPCDDPTSTLAWPHASEGQRRLGHHLNSTLEAAAVVLHDRTVPGSQAVLDHVVVGPTGIWVIDARRDLGRVEAHDLGTTERPDPRLFVGGCDETKSVTVLDGQVTAIRRVLEPVGFGGAPVTSAVCFTDADFPFMASPFRVRGAWVLWTKRLGQMIGAQQLFSFEAIRIVGEQLRAELPPAS